MTAVDFICPVGGIELGALGERPVGEHCRNHLVRRVSRRDLANDVAAGGVFLLHQVAGGVVVIGHPTGVAQALRTGVVAVRVVAHLV